jgi:phosphoserine phosphatase
VDHKGQLVGVMQLLNKANGVFEASDEALATALAAQCAMALQRVRMTEAVIEGEKMRRELEMARTVQMSTLPAQMPAILGYDMHGLCQPAGLAGGDTFDLANIEQGLLVVLGDATGHGMGPALSVTQMQAMLRMAFRMGADLETAFVQVNNQLADTLADDRFITAFIGLLDVDSHRLRFHSGGQAPILHYRAASGTFESFRPTSFPLAAMPLTKMRPALSLELAPGDILVLLSDGIYEYAGPGNEQFGDGRVRQLVAAHAGESPARLTELILAAVTAFAQGAPQEDDMTIVLVKREPSVSPTHTFRTFARSFDSLQEIFAFTGAFFAENDVEPRSCNAIDFAIEELFTNMVKYSPDGAPEIRIDIAAARGGVEVVLTDYDVDRFDVTEAPDAAVDLPVEQRRPGGLGLHLIRRLVDSIDYEYHEETRQSRIVFLKMPASPETQPSRGNGDDRN